MPDCRIYLPYFPFNDNEWITGEFLSLFVQSTITSSSSPHCVGRPSWIADRTFRIESGRNTTASYQENLECARQGSENVIGMIHTFRLFHFHLHGEAVAWFAGYSDFGDFGLLRLGQVLPNHEFVVIDSIIRTEPTRIFGLVA